MPESATFKQLADSGHLQFGDGYRTKRSEHGQPGLPILRVAEVLDGRISPQFDDYVRGDFRAAMGGRTSHPGDIVLTTKGTVGRVAAISASDPEFVYSPQLCYFRTPKNGPLNSGYLYYWFKGEEFWRQAEPLKAQTDMADYISLRDIKSLVITLPSLSHQRAIAEVLGAFDDKIVVNERIISACLEMASILLQRETSTGRSKNISLKDAASWLSGGTPRTSEQAYWSGDIPWISAASLKSFLIRDSERRLTDIGATSGTKVVPRGTTLCVVRGMSLKTEFRMGITMRKVAFGQDCKAFIPHGDITPHVLAYSLRNNRTNVLELVDEAGHGTGRLDSELLGSIQLAVPEKQRMGQIEQRLEELTSLADMRRRESEKLGRLRDSLLPKLMSGQVRIRDAEKVVEDAV